MGKQRPAGGKSAKPPETATPTPPNASPAPVKIPPLFRKIDWLALVITFVVLWGLYLFTLAPELTIEDSGELCTGAFYAGIPHPPGYPFWAVYSWLWTAILPFGNVAWRVEVGESFAAAMGCGLVALLISRGSSMLIEGIDELKNVSNRWETAICLVTGCVTGLLAGLDSYMWSEAVVINRISLFGVPWLTVVLVLILRWIYAPQQRKYLYWAMYIYGLCATIHQSLLLSAMGIEVAIAAVQPKLGRDLFLTNSIIYLICLIGKDSVPALQNMSSLEDVIFHVVGLGSILAAGRLGLKTAALATEWKTILMMGLVWTLGVCFYLYEPISCMTNPPMEWSYPRTVEGFFHGLGRGQYETVHNTELFTHPWDFFTRFLGQLGYIYDGLVDSFGRVFVLIGLIPFLFLSKMQKRERAWMVGLMAIYFCLSVLMVVMLDVTPDRSATELNKVFFTASHTLFAIVIGYGLTLMAAYVATQPHKFRRPGLIGGCVAILLAIYGLNADAGRLYFGLDGHVSLFALPYYVAQAFSKLQYGSPVFANLILMAMTIVFAAALLFYRQRGPVLILLGLYTVMPVYSGFMHWYKSEQRDHWFGYWYGHDMFSPPFGVYPEMTKDAVLFGGTDPGRFCPTYMIFCESFIPHQCQPLRDQKFNRRDVYIITQNALSDATYLQYIRAQYFRSAENDPPFFSELLKYVASVPFGESGANNPLVNGLASLVYHVVDQPLTKFGLAVETHRRQEGIYPAKEIYTPSPEDSQQAFSDYVADYQRRQALGQLKPGEQLTFDNGRVSVSGQTSMMTINGLLCKVIFDHCPDHEFYVEESAPIDWMYPYESPYGIIMKINRDPVNELTPDILQRDHAFWSQFSGRLIGNWITYDTPVKQIADFVDKLYIRNNFAGFKGDPKFARDDDAQKGFSKLRSSIAGMYAWRCFPKSPANPFGCPQELLQKTPASQAALIRETDFAFKQAFSFCPYSPDALFRYINFLLQLNRVDDALIVAETCLKLDPFNDQIKGVVDQLEKMKSDSGARTLNPALLQSMDDMARTNPANVPNLLTLASVYLQMQNPSHAQELFDTAIGGTNISASDVASIAQFYSQIGNLPKLETALHKLVTLSPDVPEPRFDLARLEATLGQTEPALKDLAMAIQESNARRMLNPAARDLAEEARSDSNLSSLRSLPAFSQIVPPLAHNR